MKTRKELQNCVSNKIKEMTGTRYYLCDIDIVIDALIYVIEQALVKDESVQIQGFGTFKPHHYKERVVRHPATGQEITVKAYTGVKFTPGLTLKRSVADGIVRYERVSDLGNESDGTKA